MLEVSQAHILLQMIQKFKQELSLLEHEVYSIIPARKPPVSMVLTDPSTGRPFEKKPKKRITKHTHTPLPPRNGIQKKNPMVSEGSFEK